MEMPQIGKMIIAVGAILIAIGVILVFFGNKFSWFGNLPGDFKIEKEGFKFYAPLSSMIIVSSVLTVIVLFIRKLIG